MITSRVILLTEIQYECTNNNTFESEACITKITNLTCIIHEVKNYVSRVMNL